MKIILEAGTSHIKINGVAYNKGSVSVNYVDDILIFLYKGQSLYVNIPLDEIGYYNDDEEETVFESIQLLKEFIDTHFYELYPEYRPYRIVSTDGIVLDSVKNYTALLGQLYAINMATEPRYVKLYDKASAPVPADDTPVYAFVLPGVEQLPAIEGEEAREKRPAIPMTLIDTPVKLYKGLAIAITGGIEDTDTTAIEAGDVILNMAVR